MTVVDKFWCGFRKVYIGALYVVESIYRDREEICGRDWCGFRKVYIGALYVLETRDRDRDIWQRQRGRDIGHHSRDSPSYDETEKMFAF